MGKRLGIITAIVLLAALGSPLKAGEPLGWIRELAEQLHHMEGAWNAMKRGDYKTAIINLERLGEEGYSEAQVVLGFIYVLGMPPHYDEAAEWFRRAAARGSATSQWYLGRMHALGNGVPQDFAAAHRWYSLAAAQGHEAAQRDRDELAVGIPSEQVAETERFVEQWEPEK